MTKSIESLSPRLTNTEAPGGGVMAAKAGSSVEALQNAVSLMDAMAQGGFCKIAAIARLALLALETPRGAGDTESLAYALECIRDLSVETVDCINATAEDVGHNYTDKAWDRRTKAYFMGRQATS